MLKAIQWRAPASPAVTSAIPERVVPESPRPSAPAEIARTASLPVRIAARTSSVVPGMSAANVVSNVARTAWLAWSPALCPPIPSATRKTGP